MVINMSGLVKLHCKIPVESEKVDKAELRRIAVKTLSEQIEEYVLLQFDYGTETEDGLYYDGYLVLADMKGEQNADNRKQSKAAKTNH